MNEGPEETSFSFSGGGHRLGFFPRSVLWSPVQWEVVVEAHVGIALSDPAGGGPWQGVFSLFLNLLSLRHAHGHVTADTSGS